MTTRSNGNLRGPRLSVLLYHNVGPLIPGTNRWLTVSPRRFQQQVRWLARHGYSGISAQQWLAHLRGQAELPRKPVMLTFDDGYRALAEHAFPVLAEHGFRAVVFIVTGLVGKTNAWDEAKGDASMPLLSAEELRHWSERGIEFGAHSRTHADLRQLGERELSGEIAGSRADLEQLLGCQVCSFAYPYGFWNESVRAEVARNFPLCFSVDGKLNDSTTDPLHIRRTMVLPLDTTTDIRFRASMGWSPRAGMLSLLADLRNRVLRRPPYDR